MTLMCNEGIVTCLSEPENPIGPHLMETTTHHFISSDSSTHASSLVLNEEPSRIKFLCSFTGNILPRPQDGKPRYVGGETRIVSVPREIKFDELMCKMRELYEGAAVLKYQQPDEDLDALVSVVNDDDVTNMIEEYDKLGSGDGFTRLRIFLFPYPEADGGSSHYDGDERDQERRYVDALNHLNEGTEFRKLHLGSTVIGSFDDLHGVEQFFSPMSLEGGGGLHSQRNEMHMSQYSLHHLNIPHSGSGQHYPAPIGQRYNEMEAPWSPAIYSPRHHGHIDPRPLPEFPSSPTSARYRMPFSDAPDRAPEEYARPPLNHQGGYEHQPQYSDNVVWLPSGAVSGDKLGFPGNVLHGNNLVEGNSVSEHCRVCLRRNQPHYEHASLVNGFHQVANTCADCHPKLHHGYTTEPNNDSSSLYNENQNQWIAHHLSSRADESRSHGTGPGPGKLNDHCIIDGPGMSLPHVRTNMTDMRHQSGNFIHQRAGSEMGNEVFHDRPMAGPSHVYIPPPEDRSVRYGNPPFAYGVDNVYPMSHAHPQGHAAYRNAQSTMHALSPSNLVSQINGSVAPGYLKHEGSPRYCVAADAPNMWVDSSPKVTGFDGKSVSDYPYGHTLNVNPNTLAPEIHQQVPPELIQHAPDIISSATPLDATMRLLLETELSREGLEVVDGKKLENSEMQFMNQQKLGDKNEAVHLDSVDIKSFKLTNDCDGNDHSAPEVSNLTVSDLSFVPELMGSIKKATIDAAEEVKEKVEGTNDPHKSISVANEAAASNSLEPANTPGDCKADSDSENINNSKIEPTKAKAEAISKGLQAIRNDDLEEIRELGSGTYGAVFHGKWKGSDVAIKRIKASCFAGRPSERERLIADFWKEALILGSLHHPNVVSFYGIVRDGPDGSLATVTEFMVNGSLKQFLQKKDRTIDRRKRLIIAMDAAFGMEYLHGKNIVHFDLKCENLLVNMRDPQRPVCKIGDLGLSKVKQQTLVSGGVRGTLPWMAPELLSGKSHMVTEKIDVYSFGIVMWELLTGDEPYADRHCASIIGGIVNNTLRPQIPSWCDPEWKALMESCWGSEPGLRPSFSEISQKLRNMAAAMNVK